MECTNDFDIPPNRSERFYYRCFLSTLIIVILVASFSSKPLATSIHINEFQVSTVQAVELINLDSTSINISGWFLDDSGGVTYYTIPPDTTLAQNQCVVFLTNFNFNTTSGDTVRLFDSSANPTQAGSTLIDSHTYSTPPSSGNSFGRNPDGTGSFIQASPSLGFYNSSGLSCTVAPTTTSTPTAIPSPTETVTIPPTPSHSPTSVVTATTTESPTPTPSPIFTLTPTVTPLPPGTPTFTTIPTSSHTPSPTPTSYKHNLYISEVLPNPSNGTEWVEIYNDNSFSVTLTNYGIDDMEDLGASPQLFSTTIVANGYTTVDMSGSVFNNDSDFVRLLDENETEIKMFMYSSTSPNISWGLETPVTLGIYCLQTSSKKTTNNSCIEPTPTKTHTPTPTSSPTRTGTATPTSTITPTQASGIYISEILAITDSDNPKEWIEIYNDNDYAVNIVNWYVGDNSNHEAQVFTADLDPYRFAYVEFTSSRLNNDGDTSYLLDSQKNQIDSFTYTETKQGYSWGRKKDDFEVFCLQTPSKNNFNTECVPFGTSTLAPSPTHTPTKTPSQTKTPTPTRTATPSKSPSPTQNHSFSDESLDSQKQVSVLGSQSQRHVEHIDYTPQKLELGSKSSDPTNIETDDEFAEVDTPWKQLVTNSHFNLVGLVVVSNALGVTLFDLWKKIKRQKENSPFEDI